MVENHDNLELIYKEGTLNRDDKDFEVIEIDNVKEALKYVISDGKDIKQEVESELNTLKENKTNKLKEKLSKSMSDLKG